MKTTHDIIRTFTGPLANETLRAIVLDLENAGQDATHVTNHIGYCYADNIIPSHLDDTTFNSITTHVANNPKLAKIWATAKVEPISISFAVHADNMAYYNVSVLKHSAPMPRA